jgi:hypothetical protein
MSVLLTSGFALIIKKKKKKKKKKYVNCYNADIIIYLALLILSFLVKPLEETVLGVVKLADTEAHFLLWRYY